MLPNTFSLKHSRLELSSQALRVLVSSGIKTSDPSRTDQVLADAHVFPQQQLPKLQKAPYLLHCSLD